MEEEIELDEHGMPTQAWLEHMYVDQRVSHKTIAKMTGINSSTLYYLMKDMGIPFRHPAPPIEKEVLERMYVQEDLSAIEIANRLHTTPDRIQHFLRNVYHIPVKQPKPRKTIHPTKEWLIQKHFQEGVSWKDIRQMVGYGAATFHKLLKDYAIPAKQYVDVQNEVTKEDLYQWHVVEGMTAKRIAEKLGCHNSTISRLIRLYEIDPGRPLVNLPRIPPISKDELTRLYEQEQLSLKEIASQFHVSSPTVGRWLKDYGMTARRYEQRLGREANRIYARSDIPTTRHGREFSADERRKILSRDEYQCQMPGCECREQWKLEIHHIIPVEQDGTNELANGITLCRTCHIRIKNNEIHYTELFQRIVCCNVSKSRYIGETLAEDNPDGRLVEEVPSEEDGHQSR